MNIEMILQFLTNLKENNNREWFVENKSVYEEAKKEFEIITSHLIKNIHEFDPEIGNLAPKDCIFRIYRDVRFSKDKAPYKTNFGTFICKEGRKSGNAGYYLHLDPEESFLGGGIHMPPPPQLKVIREHIYQNYHEFVSIIDHPDFKNYFGEVSGDKLVRPPKGYDADFIGIEYLKMKSFVSFKKINKEKVAANDFLSHVINSFKATKDFNNFLNEAFGRK